MDNGYQELQQNDSIIAADLAVGIAVRILLLGASQCDNVCHCLVQQNRIGNVYTAVHVDIAVQCQSAFTAFRSVCAAVGGGGRGDGFCCGGSCTSGGGRYSGVCGNCAVTHQFQYTETAGVDVALSGEVVPVGHAGTLAVAGAVIVDLYVKAYDLVSVERTDSVRNCHLDDIALVGLFRAGEECVSGTSVGNGLVVLVVDTALNVVAFVRGSLVIVPCPTFPALSDFTTTFIL